MFPGNQYWYGNYYVPPPPGGGGVPLGQPVGPPPPLPRDDRGGRDGQQVTVGSLPTFRALDKSADVERRSDWIEHVFDRLFTNGSGIRWRFDARRVLPSVSAIDGDFDNAASRVNTAFEQVNGIKSCNLTH